MNETETQGFYIVADDNMWHKTLKMAYVEKCTYSERGISYA